MYERGTSYLKSVALISHLLAGILADLLVVEADASLKTLVVISAVFVCMGACLGFFVIQPVRSNTITQDTPNKTTLDNNNNNNNNNNSSNNSSSNNNNNNNNNNDNNDNSMETGVQDWDSKDSALSSDDDSPTAERGLLSVSSSAATTKTMSATHEKNDPDHRDSDPQGFVQYSGLAFDRRSVFCVYSYIFISVSVSISKFISILVLVLTTSHSYPYPYLYPY